MTVNVLLLRTAGTNCDEETQYAFEKAGARVERVHVNRLREEPGRLESAQILTIPGGFSYGDDLGAGKVLANELKHFLAEPLRAFLERGGLLLGICNGFQVLVKAGLLPGGDARATLAGNTSARFESRWVNLEAVSEKTPFLKKGDRLLLPCAHGEGRFLPDRPETLAALERAGQVVLKYVDEEGRAGPYPVNPNGSAGDVAGLCDPSGRVFALMPHPERHVEFHHHPRWTREGKKVGDEGDGMRVFRNAVAYFS